MPITDPSNEDTTYKGIVTLLKYPKSPNKSALKKGEVVNNIQPIDYNSKITPKWSGDIIVDLFLDIINDIYPMDLEWIPSVLSQMANLLKAGIVLNLETKQNANIAQLNAYCGTNLHFYPYLEHPKCPLLAEHFLVAAKKARTQIQHSFVPSEIFNAHANQISVVATYLKSLLTINNTDHFYEACSVLLTVFSDSFKASHFLEEKLKQFNPVYYYNHYASAINRHTNALPPNDKDITPKPKCLSTVKCTINDNPELNEYPTDLFEMGVMHNDGWQIAVTYSLRNSDITAQLEKMHKSYIPGRPIILNYKKLMRLESWDVVFIDIDDQELITVKASNPDARILSNLLVTINNVLAYNMLDKPAQKKVFELLRQTLSTCKPNAIHRLLLPRSLSPTLPFWHILAKELDYEKNRNAFEDAGYVLRQRKKAPLANGKTAALFDGGPIQDSSPDCYIEGGIISQWVSDPNRKERPDKRPSSYVRKKGAVFANVEYSCDRKQIPMYFPDQCSDTSSSYVSDFSSDEESDLAWCERGVEQGSVASDHGSENSSVCASPLLTPDTGDNNQEDEQLKAFDIPGFAAYP